MILNLTDARKVTVRAWRPGDAEGAHWSAAKLRGFYDPNLLEIVLVPSWGPADQADTLLHEIIHAVWDERSMPKRPSEESVCDKLGTALAQVFALNPWVMSAIVGALYHAVPIVTELTKQEAYAAQRRAVALANQSKENKT